MADPRLSTSIVGTNAEYARVKIDGTSITYSAAQAGGSAVVGRAVSLSAAGTVELSQDGAGVLGKLISVESDGYATVQTGGAMTLPGGAAATLTLAKAIVGAASAAPANGYIREVATATAAELGVCRGYIYDATDATAVVVVL